MVLEKMSQPLYYEKIPGEDTGVNDECPYKSASSTGKKDNPYEKQSPKV